ncbi:MAG: hypothetical protein PHH00_00630 [Candidatus Nanoarchaeia archaeon]|nr:hypothetical protein [Candidatus Nanoarchaeia archaeon]
MSEEYRRDFVEHLKRALFKGYKEDSLRWASINQGYSDVVVDRAMSQAKKEIADEEARRTEKDKPQIKVEIYDENNKLVNPGRKPFWKRIFGGN